MLFPLRANRRGPLSVVVTSSLIQSEPVRKLATIRASTSGQGRKALANCQS